MGKSKKPHAWPKHSANVDEVREPSIISPLSRLCGKEAVQYTRLLLIAGQNEWLFPCGIGLQTKPMTISNGLTLIVDGQELIALVKKGKRPDFLVVEALRQGNRTFTRPLWNAGQDEWKAGCETISDDKYVTLYRQFGRQASTKAVSFRENSRARVHYLSHRIYGKRSAMDVNRNQMNIFNGRSTTG